MQAPDRYGARAADPDDGWGPATAVRATGASGNYDDFGPATRVDSARVDSGQWHPGQGAYPGRDGYGGRDAAGEWSTGWDDPTADRLAVPERGLPGWGALLVLLAIAGVGLIYDMVTGTQVSTAFNVCLIIASVVAILAVRRTGMFPIVIAPPIVYYAAAAIVVTVRGGGLHNRSAALKAALNLAVSGFPAIAGATAAVLIIGGIRLYARR